MQSALLLSQLLLLALLFCGTVVVAVAVLAVAVLFVVLAVVVVCENSARFSWHFRNGSAAFARKFQTNKIFV